MPEYASAADACDAYILSFKCPDRIGVVALYSGLLYAVEANITEVSNYSDPVTRTFFLRCVFDISGITVDFEEFTARLAALAAELDMEYTLRCVAERPRVMLAVSKYDHCLSALLTKWRAGALPANIVGVVSNHEDCRELSEWYGLPYHHLPITRETKPQQETAMLEVFEAAGGDLLVLARYMQILSDTLCEKLRGRAINIHHSFLPGFKGAKPYHQAYERGVKVIGATAHYVTPDLDEGPIIAQEVRPIDHEISVEQMVHLGHDIESAALSQAVRLHCEQRVILNGQRTVIL
ncbi:formyltetrahydrofolate deformylase [Mangrovimicrobium sediminis]|uniref:Formyltetrahydrofolate deformylase n=1 Tax=Mangrovimicrobium sediminis TaxID=2562682 RepID=A0A4Z0M6K8_9GAMM|nr:formyltetrahydrofolate deformylase [Haliea sp. SAOS-164]TGD75134.1 formyltetrahydrofolate deformylase [Haliea sp. SAOS-164]